MLICLSLSAYFSYNAKYGRHGLDARARLLAKATALDADIDTLGLKTSALAHDAVLLRANPPDPDIVEEISRDVLGYARGGEILVRIRH